jgi:hypothetical protein
MAPHHCPLGRAPWLLGVSHPSGLPYGRPEAAGAIRTPEGLPCPNAPAIGIRPATVGGMFEGAGHV